MPVLDKEDDRVIRLAKQEAAKFNAKVNKIDLKNQVLDIECPEESKEACAAAIEKVLESGS
jgi:hypothetical protein